MEDKLHPVFSSFLVSTAGTITSTKTGKILKPQEVTGGYLYVCLTINKHRKYKGVHRMVAETWIENPKNFSEINHIDGNKNNNSVDNLEWCSHSHNMRHENMIGKSNHSLTQDDVDLIHRLIETGCTQTEIASRIKVSRTTIYHILKEKTWSS